MALGETVGSAPMYGGEFTQRRLGNGNFWNSHTYTLWTASSYRIRIYNPVRVRCGKLEPTVLPSGLSVAVTVAVPYELPTQKLQLDSVVQMLAGDSGPIDDLFPKSLSCCYGQNRKEGAPCTYCLACCIYQADECWWHTRAAWRMQWLVTAILHLTCPSTISVPRHHQESIPNDRTLMKTKLKCPFRPKPYRRSATLSPHHQNPH